MWCRKPWTERALVRTSVDVGQEAGGHVGRHGLLQLQPLQHAVVHRRPHRRHQLRRHTNGSGAGAPVFCRQCSTHQECLDTIKTQTSSTLPWLRSGSSLIIWQRQLPCLPGRTPRDAPEQAAAPIALVACDMHTCRSNSRGAHKMPEHKTDCRSLYLSHNDVHDGQPCMHLTAHLRHALTRQRVSIAQELVLLCRRQRGRLARPARCAHTMQVTCASSGLMPCKSQR